MLIDYHRRMVADSRRNTAFYEALKRVIVPGKTRVADIGAGTGILGMMAAQLGAVRVDFYERETIIGLAAELARQNNLADRCRFYHASSTECADAPEVDIIVAEVLGNYALEEHIIATLNDARRFLASGGRIIPGALTQMLCPIIAPALYEELCVWDRVGFGLNFASAKHIGLNNIYVRTALPTLLLDGGRAAQTWDRIDLTRKAKPTRQGKGEWVLSAPTTIYGAALWWEADLAPGVQLGTGPFDHSTHWEQLYAPVLEPIAATTGDVLEIAVRSTTSEAVGTTLFWTFTLRRGAKILTRQSLDLEKGFL